MVTRPERETSRAVLIGTAAYTTMPELPGVRNNLRAMAQVLTDPAVCGFDPEHCAVIADPSLPGDVLTPVRRAAAEARDTLVVYYAGHGLLDPYDGQLHLGLVGSTSEEPENSVSYDLLRKAVRGTRATCRLIILDSCYSGSAMGLMSDPTQSLAGQARVDGAYLMCAASANQAARAPEGEEYTAFTGELVDVLLSGVPNGREFLSLDDVFQHVHDNLAAKARPQPRKQVRDTMGELAFARNRVWIPSPPAAGDQDPPPPSQWPTAGEGAGGAAARPLSRPVAASVTVDVVTADGFREAWTLAPEGGWIGESRPVTRVDDETTYLQRTADPRVSGSRDRLINEIQIGLHLIRCFEAAYPRRLARLVAYNLDSDEPFVLFAQRGVPVAQFQGKIVTEGSGLEVSMLRALRLLENAGVVHHNITPTTVLWDGTDVQLTDFRVARLVGEPYGTEQPARKWSAPEARDPRATADPAADLWSAGCVLVSTIDGHLPLPNGQLDRTIGPELARLVDGFFRHNPQDRPSLDLVLRDLGPGLADEDMDDVSEPGADALRAGRIAFDEFLRDERADSIPLEVTFMRFHEDSTVIRCPLCLNRANWREQQPYGRTRKGEYEPLELDGLDPLIFDEMIRDAHLPCPHSQANRHFVPSNYVTHGLPLPIAVIGSTFSGKTTMLASIDYEMRRGGLRSKGVRVRPLDTELSSAFQSEVVIPLFRGGEQPRATPLQPSDEPVFPRLGWVLSTGSSERAVALFEMPSDTDGGNYLPLRQIQVMKGLLVIVDPAAEDHGALDFVGAVLDRMDDRTARGLPVAVAVNKCDEQMFDSPVMEYLRRDGTDPNSASPTGRESRDGYAYLASRGLHTALRVVETFSNSTVHFVSATGSRAVDGHFPYGVRPRRVLNPLAAILAMHGVFGTVRETDGWARI